jgi:hypothetical protein
MSDIRDSDAEFVKWLGDRLVQVYGESNLTDFVTTTYRTSRAIAERDLTIQQLEEQLEHLLGVISRAAALTNGSSNPAVLQANIILNNELKESVQ